MADDIERISNVEDIDQEPDSMALTGAETLFGEDDGMEVTLDLSPEELEMIAWTEEEEVEEVVIPHEANLAEFLAEEAPAEMKSWAQELIEAVDADKESRSEWEQVFTEGLKLMGIKGRSDADSSDLQSGEEDLFEGASDLFHPLITEAMTQFQSEALRAMIPPKGPVDTQIMGVETPERKDQSKRVRGFMNYQCMHDIEDYVEEHDKLLSYLAKSGSAFKKVWYNQVTRKIEVLYLPCENVIVPYSATSLAKTPRIAHCETISRNEMEHRIANGMYREVDIQPAAPSEGEVQEALDAQEGVTMPGLDDEDEYEVMEIHAETVPPLFEADRGGLSAPYIIHVDKASCEVLAIYRNWEQADPLFKRKSYFVHYPLIQSDGFYGYGFIHLLGNLARGATAALRQLLDAGTLSNLQGGFKKKGTRMANDGDPIAPGEFRDVEAYEGRIQDSIMQLQFPEPSGTLYQLLGFLVDAGRRMVSLTDINVGDGNQEAPVGTTIALLERGMNVMSAVHMRLCRAMKNEFDIIARISSENLPQTYPYDVPGESREVYREDFDGKVDIVPVCDPRQFSQSQRIARAQNKLQLAQQAPQIFNVREAYRDMLREIDDSNLDRIIPPEQDAEPVDPMTENAEAIRGRPLKAFLKQNHDAHIAAHRALLENPELREQQEMLQAVQAHIQEHLSMKYQVQVMQQMGVSDPKQLDQLPDEQLAVAVAQATQQITGQAQALEEAQRRAEEPTIEQQALMKETENDRLELQRKAQNDQMQHARAVREQQMKHSIDQQDIAQNDRASLLSAGAQVFSTLADNEQQRMDTFAQLVEKLGEQQESARDEAGREAGDGDNE